MNASNRLATPPDSLATLAADSSEFGRALLAGLAKSPKSLPCKYFYDEAGSILFDRICELPEYYPTRTELGLLEDHAADFAALIGADAELVEFGAGAGRKVRLLLDALEQPRAYLPIDISGDYLQGVANRLAADYPDLGVRPIIADYTKPFALPPMTPGARRVGFFPGSTIGNFPRAEAISFLHMAAHQLAGGGLLIGVDLVKDPNILHAAYNDVAGITAAFNKNILKRANDELGADFNLDGFAHYAFYDPRAQRIEMHLVSLTRQRVRLLNHEIAFAEGETTHTEDSHKYTVDGFRALAAEAGFTPRAVWTDPAKLFSIHWLDAPETN
jgi:dimethylhistidine N-methyltransferase